jgi:hypothetical protein
MDPAFAKVMAPTDSVSRLRERAPGAASVISLQLLRAHQQQLLIRCCWCNSLAAIRNFARAVFREF